MNPLPGTSSLVEILDTRVQAVLRDGRHLVGVLRSFDKFSNLVLEQCVERRHVGNTYADYPVGLYLLRGDNIVLLGQINAMNEQQFLSAVSPEGFKELAQAPEAKAILESEESLWDMRE